MACSYSEESEDDTVADSEADVGDYSYVKARVKSAMKLKSAWESIFEKYSDSNIVTDVVDIATWEIVEDNGHLRSIGLEDLSADDGEDDGEDEVMVDEDVDAREFTVPTDSFSYTADESEKTKLQNLEALVASWMQDEKYKRTRNELDKLIEELQYKQGTGLIRPKKFEDLDADASGSEDGGPVNAGGPHGNRVTTRETKEEDIEYLGMRPSRHRQNALGADNYSEPLQVKPSGASRHSWRKPAPPTQARADLEPRTGRESIRSARECENQEKDDESVYRTCGTPGYHCGRSFCFSCVE